MSNETVFSYSAQATAIAGSATGSSIASNSFNASSDCTSLTSTSTGNYPLGDVALFASFSTSVSSASNTVVLYRRDMSIDGANNAPIPQSAAPAYSNIQVGAFVIPPFTAASSGYFACPDVPLSSAFQFYIENKTNATIISTYTVKVTPKTYAPAP